MKAGSPCGTDVACRTGANEFRAVAGRLVVFAAKSFSAALIAMTLISPAAAQLQEAAFPGTGYKRANFQREAPSVQARQIADWIVQSGNHSGLTFAIVDKTAAKVFVFHPDGRLRGAAPALLGIARGDDSVPGIGERELSDMPPEVRTTPAGRFVASLGRNASGKDVLWVDYDAAISMHRVIDSNPKERRPHRLATPTPLDNRISYGCINVPVKFFDDVVSPAFEGANGIVYILPEVRPLKKVFAAFGAEENATAPATVDSVPASLASNSRGAIGK